MRTENKEKTVPAIGLGMPVYNGARTVGKVIESLLGQTFTDFEIVISDNASEDNTENICREYVKKDKRIKYTRQNRNIGAMANFRYVLQHSRGEYFRWCACDDIISPEFLEVNYNFLRNNEFYIASISKARYEHGDYDEIKMGDRGLEGNDGERLKDFFTGWHANARFYSLIRRQVIEQCPYIGNNYFGADWTITLYLASKGKMKRNDVGWIEIGENGTSRRNGAFKTFEENMIDKIAPFNRFTMDVVKMISDLPTKEKWTIYRSLAYMNTIAIWGKRKMEIKWGIGKMKKIFGGNPGNENRY